MDNRRGSALAWTVIMMTVLTIIAFAILSTGYAYVARSTRNHAERQAYLTARSALEAVVATLNGLDTTVTGTQTADYTGEAYDDFALPPPGGTVNITGFSEFADALGTVGVTLTRKDASSIVLAAVATRGDASETLYAHLNRNLHVNRGDSSGFIGVSAGNLTMSSGNTLTIHNGDLYVDEHSHGHSNSIDIIGDGRTLYQTKKKNPQVNHGVYNMDSIKVTVGSVQYTKSPPPAISVSFPTALKSFDTHGGSVLYCNMYQSNTPVTYVFNDVMKGRSPYSCYVDDQRDYFIRVPANKTLLMEAVQTASSRGVTELFVEVENGGKLEINRVAPNVHLYINGKPGSTILIDAGVSFTGALSGSNVNFEGDATIHFVPPSSSAAGGVSGGGADASTTYTWNLVRYAKEG